MRALWFRLSCWWHGYDPAFVKNVLEANASPNEATFDNVEDLLEYLNKN